MTYSDDLPPTRTLAALYEKQGLLRQAEEVYERLLEADPDQPEVQDALQEVRERLAKKKPPSKDPYKSVLFELDRWKSAVHSRREAVLTRGTQGLRIVIILGPRIVVPEKRDKKSDGKITLGEEFERKIGDEAEKLGVGVEIILALDEAAFIRGVVAAREKCDGLVLNPECLTLGAIEDSVFTTQGLPVVEVFFDNTRQGEAQKSPVTRFVDGSLSGFGVDGFLIAIRAVFDMAISRMVVSEGTGTEG
jgi:3-dehydroquinate dehydratase-2